MNVTGRTAALKKETYNLVRDFSLHRPGFSLEHTEENCQKARDSLLTEDIVCLSLIKVKVENRNVVCQQEMLYCQRKGNKRN